jgi:hypothetical protein
MLFTRSVYFKIFTVTGLLIVAVSVIFLKAQPQIPSIHQPSAFFNASWGMTPNEVQHVNSRALHPTESRRKFYSVKQGIDPSRYQAMQEEGGRHFLGRPAEITYIFFDGHLFSYHVFVRDRDALALDQDMRKALIRRFGDDPHVVEDRLIKMIWNQKDIFVNYWFFMDDLSLSGEYIAGYGVVYRPIEEAISG